MTEGKYLEPFGFVNASAKIINKTIYIFMIEFNRVLVKRRKVNKAEPRINNFDLKGVENEKRYFLQNGYW